MNRRAQIFFACLLLATLTAVTQLFTTSAVGTAASLAFFIAALAARFWLRRTPAPLSDEYLRTAHTRGIRRALFAAQSVLVILAVAMIGLSFSADLTHLGILLRVAGLLTLYAFTAIWAMPSLASTAADTWARTMLADAHVNPTTTPIQAIRTLRDAAPNLPLAAATALIEKLREEDGRAG